MTRGILIAGNDSPILAALGAEALKRVEGVVLARAPNRYVAEADSRPAAAEAARAAPAAARSAVGLVELAWNPASPLSARALCLGAANRLGRVDEALLVCSPLAVRRRADELSPADVDAAVDDLIKGWFFLARELAAMFRARGPADGRPGSLALVLADAGLGGTKDDAPDLVGSPVAAACRSLGQGLLAASFKEPYKCYAFGSAEIGEDSAFAAFVFKILDEENKRDAGKWHKYGRPGLFGFR
jgi:hypothetical protein